jgi:predicted ATPase
MKISKLHVQGFRSLKDVEWYPGDLNIVIGPNGSGKSNLLKLLELINQSSIGALEKYINREGGINAVLWDNDSETIGLALLVHSSLFSGPSPFQYKFKVKPDPKHLSYSKIEEYLAEVPAGQENVNPELVKQLLTVDELSSFAYLISNGEKIFETALSFCNKPNFIPIEFYHIRNALSNWKIYHYFRTDQDSPVRQPAVTQFSPNIEPDGSNLVSVLHTLYTNNREFKKEIDLAMKSAFGADFEELLFPPASQQKIQLAIRWKNLKNPIYASDLSDGTLRFLFLITILANPEPPPLIAIDEPETGLHPSMMSIIADFAKQAAGRTQVVISTHSADFLDAFHDVTPTITVAECVNGETILKIPPEDKLKEWLKDYKLGEIYRMRQLEDM